MKHYCRKTNIFLYICLALFAYSCSEENNFVKEQNHSKLKFEQKTFEEVLKIPIFNEAYRKISKSKTVFNKSAEARTALEDQYGFTIVENSPVRITTEEDGSIFYTLLIERDVKENLKFENLMIQVKDDETAAAIFKYIMSEKGTKSQTGEYFFKDAVSSDFIDLNVEGKMFFSSNSDGDTCITTTQLMCNATWSGEPYDHIANYNCWMHAAAYGLSSLYNTSSTVCYGDGGGGNSSSDGGSSSNNTGGHGASDGSGNGSLVITPIPCKTGNCIEDDLSHDPCSELKKMKNNSVIEADIQRLKGLIPTAFKEKGGSVELSTTDFTTISVAPSTPSMELESGIKWSRMPNRIGINHIHKKPIINYEMFSIEDLYSIWRLRYDFTPNFSAIGHNIDVFFINLTVGSDSSSDSGYTYSIKIDPNNTLAFNSIGNMKVRLIGENLLKEYVEYGAPDSPGARHNLLALPFLKEATKYGLKLFRTKNHENKWSEVVIDENSPTGTTLIPWNNQ